MPSPDTPTFPAPSIEQSSALSSKWQREYEAFQQLLPQLLPTYSGEYVVVHNGQVVDRGPDDVALALRFFAQHGSIPIHVGLVTGKPEPIARIPHYREFELA